MLTLALSNCSLFEEVQKRVSSVSKCTVVAGGKIALVAGDVLYQSSNVSDSWFEFPLPFTTAMKLRYQSVENHICLVSLDGGIFVLPCDAVGEDVPEFSGSFEAEMVAVEWSPDESILVAISDQGIMTLLNTCGNDVICELNLHDLPTPSEVSQTVGWGKEETQFKGAGAKKLDREGLSESSTSVNQSGPNLVASPCISWRDRSDIFAVSFYNKSTESRQLSIFDRDGKHLCRSSTNEKPGDIIAFRPVGDLIASSGKTASGGLCVNFFERNCLQHGSFVVSGEADLSIYQLFYNPTSDLLFVLTERRSKVESDERYEMRTYNRRNYHYYLVQNYSLTDKCSDFSFDPENPLALVIALRNGIVIRYEWKFAPASSGQLGETEMFAVIDGNKLLCTPFDKVLVPPPMSFYQIESKHPILSRDFFKNSLFVWTQFDLTVYSFELNEPGPETSNKEMMFGKACLDYGKYPRKTAQYKLSTLAFHKSVIPSHWTVIADAQICCIAPSKGESRGTSLFLVSLDASNETCTIEKEIPFDGETAVFDLKLHKATSGVCEIILSMKDNRLLQFDLKCHELQRLNCPRPFNDICPFDLNSNLNILGVSRNRFLYINSDLVFSEITSVRIQRTDFILFTTLGHRLYICPLSEIVRKNFNGTLDGFYSRKIERGAKIAAVVQNGTAVILQMPRGNLECIHPKILLIKLVERKLEENDHAEAFQICQKHRLDMNILCDRDFAAFLVSLPVVLRNVNSYLLLNLFISELNDKEPEIKFDKKSTVPKNKVEQVCEKLISVISADNELSQMYYLTVIMANVKLGRIEDALRTVKQNDKMNDPKSPGLKFLLLLVDVDKLFDLALGMYDKPLVLRILEKSKKDPKEFLPLINQDLFYGASNNEIEYRIDNYLKKYSKALSSLVKFQTNFDQVLRYIRIHSLHGEALKILAPNSEQWISVAKEYAGILSSKSSHLQAAILYAKLKMHPDACKSFCMAKNFEMALTMLNSMSEMDPTYHARREEIVSGLEGTGKCDKAAGLMSSYDVESSVELLVRNHCWVSAIELTASLKRPQLVSGVILPAMRDAFSDLAETISEKTSSVCSLTSRMEEIIVKKKETLALQEYVDGDFADDGTESVISTISKSSRRSTTSSQLSTASSKKLNRKKRSLKKNSPEEHLAILEEVIKLHSFFKSSLNTVYEMVLTFNSNAGIVFDTQLQLNLKTVLDSAEKFNSSVNSIWDSEDMFKVKLNEFGENETNYDSCFVKPLNSTDLHLFQKPEVLNLRVFDVFKY